MSEKSNPIESLSPAQKEEIRSTICEAPRTQAAKSESHPVKRFFKILGPGLITGASDDDPSGIVTYSQAGAAFGLATLWTALLTFPMTSVIQYLCSKIGLVTGQGLAVILKRNFPKPVLLIALGLMAIANTINAGANLGAIGAAVHLIYKPVQAHYAIIGATVLLLLVIVCGSYSLIEKIFKWLTLSLLAYVFTAFALHGDIGKVLTASFIPNIKWSADYLSVLVAILGTTISPYLFFWQTNLEVEEQKKDGKNALEREGASRDDLKYALIDDGAGVFFSNVVMFAIIYTTAQTLYAKGTHDITTAAEAASALKPVAGPWAEVIFALGLIGTGCLATPVLVGSAAYALSEAAGWKAGLNKKLGQAPGFYMTIILATLIGMAINFVKIDPMKALFGTAVINGVIAPILLTLIMILTSSKKVMGDDKVNKPLTNFIGWLTTIVMYLASIAMFVVMAMGKG